MKGVVCSVLTMIFGMTVACKLQSNHAEEKFGSKLVRGASKGADDLTAIKKLINKSNKTDDEWSELAEAVIKGGAKGDAVIRSFAILAKKEVDDFNTLLNTKLNSKTAFLRIDKAILAKNLINLEYALEKNIMLMEKVFPKLKPVERAEIFAKLHPAVKDTDSIAIKFYEVITGTPLERADLANKWEVEGYFSSNPKIFDSLYEGLLAQRQISVLFGIEDGKKLFANIEADIADIVGKMTQSKKFNYITKKYTYTVDTHLANNLSQKVTSKMNSIIAGLTNIGGKKGLTECCGEKIIKELEDMSVLLKRDFNSLKERFAGTYVTMSGGPFEASATSANQVLKIDFMLNKLDEIKKLISD